MKYDFTSIIDRHGRDSIAVDGLKVDILASRNHDSGVAETNIPDTETTFDWLD